MQVAFFCCFRQGVAGMSRDLGPDVPGLEKFCARNFGPIFRSSEWPGCPGIWVGTSRIWKNFMQENSGLIFRTLVPYIRAARLPNKITFL